MPEVNIGGGTNAPLQPDAFQQLLKGIPLPAPGTPEAKQIEDLRHLTDTVAGAGWTPAGINQLRLATANILINGPQLPPVNQALVSLFQIRLYSLPKTVTSSGAISQGGVPVTKKGYVPIGTGGGTGPNLFLTKTAMVDLFEILTYISTLEAQMERQESKLKQALSMLMITMAKDLASLTIQLGKNAAAQCQLEAQQAFMEGATCIGQVAVCVVSMVVEQVKMRSAQNEIELSNSNRREQILDDPNARTDVTSKEIERRESLPEEPNEKGLYKKSSRVYELTPEKLNEYNKLKTLSVEQELSVSNKATKGAEVFTNVFNNTLNAMKSFYTANIKLSEATLKLTGAYAQASQTMLEKLFDNIKNSTQTLATDMGSLENNIQKLLETLASIMKVSAELGKV